MTLVAGLLLAARAAVAQADPAAPVVGYAPGRGFSLTTPDEDFRLAIGAWIQMLYTLEDESDEPVTHGLEIRRARVVLSGHAFGENNRYFLQLGLSPGDMQLDEAGVQKTPLFDAFLDFTHLPDASLRVGQYRVPFSRQRVVPFGRLALIDRSLANFEFNLDRDLGVTVRSEDLLRLDWIRYYAGVFMGEGRDLRAGQDFGLLYVARLEALPTGMFDDYSETDLERTPFPEVSLGAAVAYLDDATNNRGFLGSPPSDGGTTDIAQLTADVALKWQGATLLVEAHYRTGERDYGDATIIDETGEPVPAPRELPRDGYGWHVQADTLLGDLPVDVTARYSQVRATDESSLEDTDELGGGVGWFAGGRDLRVQADYFRIYPAGDFTDGTDQLRASVRLGF